MKKMIIVGIVFVAFAAGGIFFWVSRAPVKPEQILPQGALFYLQQKEPARRLEEFTASRFWQQLKRINIRRLLERSGAGPDVTALYESFQKQSEDLSKNLLVQKFFGQEVAVVVYPISWSDNGLQILQEFLQNIVVVTRPSKDAQMAEFFARLFQQFNQPQMTETSEYKKHAITNVTIPPLAPFNIKASYANVRGWYVIGMGEGIIKKCIDAAGQPHQSLAEDKGFVLAQARFLKDAQTTAYFNLEMFIERLKNQIPKIKELMAEGEELTAQQLDQFFTNLSGFKAGGLSFMSGPLSRGKLDLHFDKNQLKEHLREVYSCTPKENRSLHFVPQQALWYQWSDCFDLKTTWGQLKKELENNFQANPRVGGAEFSSAAEVMESIEQALQLNIEDEILPLIGKEAGWIFSDVDVVGQFPLLKMIFFLKVLDPQKAAEVMAKLLEQPSLLIQSEDYKGVPIKFISTPIGTFDPGYCLMNDYLLLASTRQILKEAIDASQDQSLSLVAGERFQEVNEGLTAPSNGIGFLRFDDLMAKVKKGFAWASQWFTAKSREMEAYKAGSEKRLTDLRTEIDTKQAQLTTMQEQLRSLRQEKQKLESEGSESQALPGKINEKQLDISMIEKSLNLDREKAKELQEGIRDFDAQKTMDEEMIQFYLTEGIYPLLEAFQSIRTMGSKVIFTENSIETTVLILSE